MVPCLALRTVPGPSLHPTKSHDKSPHSTTRTTHGRCIITIVSGRDRVIAHHTIALLAVAPGPPEPGPHQQPTPPLPGHPPPISTAGLLPFMLAVILLQGYDCTRTGQGMPCP